MRTTLRSFLVVAITASAFAQTASLADRFAQLDRNSDGKLSAAEVAALPSLARLLPVADTDKDGRLSREEIRNASERWPALAELAGDAPAADEKAKHARPASARPMRREIPPNIQRIDPATGQAIDELNYMKYFQRVFGDRPSKGLWVNAVMTNQLEPFTHPQTGERMHLVTAYIMHPKDPEAPHNGAWFLVRKLDGTYEHGQIYPEGGLPSGRSLHGVRSIIESPFPEERGKVWCFAGHGAERKLLHNTAWIYKGTLQTP